MPNHNENGDNVGSQSGHVTPVKQSGSLCTGSDIRVVWKVLILTKKEPRRIMHLMRHARKKIQNLDEK